MKTFTEIMREKQLKRAAESVSTTSSTFVDTAARSINESDRKLTQDLRLTTTSGEKHKFTPIVFDLNSKENRSANAQVYRAINSDSNSTVREQSSLDNTASSISSSVSQPPKSRDASNLSSVILDDTAKSDASQCFTSSEQSALDDMPSTNPTMNTEDFCSSSVPIEDRRKSLVSLKRQRSNGLPTSDDHPAAKRGSRLSSDRCVVDNFSVCFFPVALI